MTKRRDRKKYFRKYMAARRSNQSRLRPEPWTPSIEKIETTSSSAPLTTGDLHRARLPVGRPRTQNDKNLIGPYPETVEPWRVRQQRTAAARARRRAAHQAEIDEALRRARVKRRPAVKVTLRPKAELRRTSLLGH